jgi:hypothetical protein
MDDNRIKDQQVNPAIKSYLNPTIRQNQESLFKSGMEKVHGQDRPHLATKIKSFAHLEDQMEAARGLGLRIGAAKRVDFCSRLPTATDLPSDLYHPLGITGLFPHITDYLTIAGIYQSFQVYARRGCPMS